MKDHPARGDQRGSGRIVGKPFFVAATFLILLGCGLVKVVYFGWAYRDFGGPGGYTVKAYQTVHEINPLALSVSDADGGYYRVFDRKGRKVFEVFSKQFKYDIVLPGTDQIEFQLAMETRIWTVPQDWDRGSP